MKHAFREQQLNRRTPSRSRWPVGLLATVLACAFCLSGSFVSTASALTIGLSFSSNDTGEETWESIEHSGADLYRMNITWSNVSDQGNWRESSAWQHSYDPIFEQAAKHGVTILADIYGRDKNEPVHQFYLPEESAKFKEFQEFAWTVVQRYGRGGTFWSSHSSLPYHPVTDWEVWNEPNLQLNNPGEKVLPQKYAEFLVATSGTIKTAQNEVRKAGEPNDMKVLHGGLYQPGGTSVWTFIESAHKVAGYSSSFDGLSLHPYSFSGNESEKLAGVEQDIGIANAALSEFVGSKSMWITELGWPTEGTEVPSGSPVSESEQASLLTKSFDWIKAHTGTYSIELATWYFYKDLDEDPATKWDRHCGLRGAAGGYKPSWWAYQQEAGATPWPAPTTSTDGANEVTETKATLRGHVNPNSATTSYHFEYGSTQAYGASSPVPDGSVGAGSTSQEVSTVINGLEPNIRYHARLVATNKAGTSYGDDRTFTTGLKWTLRNANSGGSPDVSFWFGSPSATRVTGDWNGDGVVTPGTYDPSTGTWKLRNSNSTGGANIEIQYGGGPWTTPVVGDWDGNGTDTIGLYNPSTGEWRLRNKNSAGGAEVEFQYGGGVWTAVTGDWDGNGTTTIGVYEPAVGTWRLRNKNSGGGAEVEFQYGGGPWKGLTGDWDGNGTTTIGLYEPAVGTWRLRNKNSGGGAEVEFQYGGGPWSAVVGDWDGNGTTTAGGINPEAETDVEWSVRNSNSSGLNVSAFFGAAKVTRVTGDWNGDGVVTPGTYDPSTGTWKLRNSNSTGGANIEFQYGGGPWTTPVVGDWDGNGTDTIGLYNPSTGEWRLRNKNSAGGAEVEFQYGGGVWTAVTGDWDGNGTTTIGVYEPAVGTWRLRNKNSGGGAEVEFQYGGGPWKGLTGDWDGNGTTTIGLYEPAVGTWRLRNKNSGGGAEVEFQYGGGPWSAVVGDWDGNGTTTAGVVRAVGSETQWVLRNENTSSSPDLGPDLAFNFGSPGSVRVTGDWNGDGVVTPGTYDPSTGTWKLRNSNSTGGANIEFQYGGGPWTTPVVGDWDGNGTDTIGLYNPSTGEWALRNSNSAGGANIQFQYGGGSWTAVTGDWDGNGTTTIGVYEPAVGTWRLRNKNSGGGAEVEFQYGGGPWKGLTGDWDGNGTTTIGLYEPAVGTWRLRNKNSGGGAEVEFQYGGGPWSAVVGDWDGNGTTTAGLVRH